MISRARDWWTLLRARLILPHDKFALFRRGIDVSHHVEREINIGVATVVIARTLRFWWVRGHQQRNAP